jgi:hypothetical protein
LLLKKALRTLAIFGHHALPLSQDVRKLPVSEIAIFTLGNQNREEKHSPGDSPMILAPPKPLHTLYRKRHESCLRTACSFLAIALFGLIVPIAHAQTTSAAATTPSQAPTAQDAGTSTDLFIMFGSDFDRPGLVPRANYNIGIGHTFGLLKKDPIGDELTFAYTYENAGSHGFLHTNFGEHTESAGVMKNFNLPRTKMVTGYTWIQSGITSYTGNAHVQNRLDSGVSLGAIVHFNNNNSIWIQESYSKVVTVSWYTTTSIGYTYSW